MKSWPLSDIPQLAAMEYADWRARKDGKAYRLPTDLEWEKAARGADARIYPWGDYLIWNYCSSRKGNWRASAEPNANKVLPVGTSPLDESVYGIRDLAGSVLEYCSDTKSWRGIFASVRGGSFDAMDEYYFRAATRNGMVQSDSEASNGFRLVMDMPHR